MDWTMTIAAALSVWAALRILGNERQRRLEEIVTHSAADGVAPPAGHDTAPVVG